MEGDESSPDVMVQEDVAPGEADILPVGARESSQAQVLDPEPELDEEMIVRVFGEGSRSLSLEHKRQLGAQLAFLQQAAVNLQSKSAASAGSQEAPVETRLSAASQNKQADSQQADLEKSDDSSLEMGLETVMQESEQELKGFKEKLQSARETGAN
jgi:hypothetical protein